MAALPETDPPTFPETITQIETTEPVVGGVTGIANRALIELANRTRWTKAQIDALVAAIGGIGGSLFDENGDYAGLRARATTKADVGLGQVSNFPATSDCDDNSANKYATAKAVNDVKNLITGAERDYQIAQDPAEQTGSGPQLAITFAAGQANRIILIRASATVDANEHAEGGSPTVTLSLEQSLDGGAWSEVRTVSRGNPGPLEFDFWVPTLVDTEMRFRITSAAFGHQGGHRTSHRVLFGMAL